MTTAASRWPEFDGWAATCGIDPVETPPDRLCNLIYYWLASSLDEKRRREFDERLQRPPSGATATTADTGAWSADSEMAAFRQAQQSTAGV